MNQEDFVRFMLVAVVEGAVRGTLATVEHPSGRDPDASLLALSEWFRRLSSSDKGRVAEIAELTAKQALYNVLLIADGLLPLKHDGELCEVEMYVTSPAGRYWLNDPSSEELTAVLKAQNGPCPASIMRRRQ